MSDRALPVLKVLRIALSILAVPLLAWVVYRNFDKFAVITQASVATFVSIIAVTLVSLLANSFRMRIAAALFDAKLGFAEAFKVASANTFYNIITPLKGGVTVKGMYLNQVHGMTWPNFGGSLIVTQLLASALSMALALVILGAFDVFPPAVIAAIAVLAGLLVVITWRSRNWIGARLARYRHLDGAADRFATIARHRGALILFAVAHLVFLFCITTRLYLVFAIFVPEIQFWQVLLIQAVITGALFISLTPGNIGVQEGLVAAAGAFFAIEPASAVLASLAERGFMLLTVLPIGALCSIPVMRRIRDAARP